MNGEKIFYDGLGFNFDADKFILIPYELNFNGDKINEISSSTEVTKDSIVIKFIRLYLLELVNLTMIDFDFQNITLKKYISKVDESINNLIEVFLGLSDIYYNNVIDDISIRMDINKRQMEYFPKYEDGLIFFQTLKDDIEPLEVYVNILRDMGIESKIIHILDMYKEIVITMNISFVNMNKSHKKAIFNVIHGL